MDGKTATSLFSPQAKEGPDGHRIRVWDARFTTLRPFSSLPRLMAIEMQRQCSPSYLMHGYEGWTHCVFKYTLSGEGFLQDAKGTHRLTPGSAILLEISDTGIEWGYPKDATEVWEFVYVDFNGANIQEAVREMISRYGHVYKLARMNPLIQRILAAAGSPSERLRDITPGDSAAFVFDILCTLENSMHETGKPLDAGAILVKKAKALIERSMPCGCPVNKLSAELKVSRAHLSRIFLRETGETPHAYMTKLRMEHAVRLLSDTEMTIKEIGDSIGIEIPQHFTRMFKKTMKMPPSQFRIHSPKTLAR